MKKLLILTGVFAVFIFASLYLVSLQANGFTDPFYLRFTTPPQTSLIIGTSRAAQGLQPEEFNKILGRDDVFNYAFTLGQSPFGQTYYESLKRKLQSDTKDGIFIVCIDPWSISSDLDNPNDSANFHEIHLALENKFVNLNPNIFYLLQYYDKPLVDLFYQEPSNMLLHQDGWLEVNVSMSKKSQKIRLDSKIEEYETENLPKFKYSEVRFRYLARTISYLKKHGEVYLVRLPVHQKMLEIDNKLMPDFNEKINNLCQRYQVNYLSFELNSNDCIYTDGNHLWKNSGKIVSQQVAEWILKQQKNYKKYQK